MKAHEKNLLRERIEDLGVAKIAGEDENYGVRFWILVRIDKERLLDPAYRETWMRRLQNAKEQATEAIDREIARIMEGFVQ